MGLIMSANRGQQSTDPKIVPTDRAYVVFDRATGEVIHVHHAVTFAAGPPLREPHEARARRLAGAKAGANAEVIEVDPAEVDRHGRLRVDPTTRKIVREG
jgi:hypothetical protein